MHTEYIEQFWAILVNAIIPAGLGGWLAFGLGLKAGLYRNSHYKKKFASEQVTTAVAAMVLVPRISSDYTGDIAFIALFIGFGSTVIMQGIRISITKVAEAYLDELLERRK